MNRIYWTNCELTLNWTLWIDNRALQFTFLLTHIVPKKVLTKKVWSSVALQPLNQTVPVLSKLGTSTNIYIYLSYKKTHLKNLSVASYKKCAKFLAGVFFDTFLSKCKYFEVELTKSRGFLYLGVFGDGESEFEKISEKSPISVDIRILRIPVITRLRNHIFGWFLVY